MTYFVKGYGFTETGYKEEFSCVFDVENVNAKTFMHELNRSSGLSPFRGNKKINIETVVVLSKQ